MNTARQARLRFVGRLSLLVLIALGTLLFLTRQANGDEILAVLPWFCVALVCYIAPPIVSKGTDIFSPPGLVGIQGGLAVTSMIASASVVVVPSFSILGVLPEYQRIALTRSAMTLVIASQLAYLFGYYTASGSFFLRMLPDVSQRRWDGRRLVIALVLTTAIFATVYALFQQRIGGSLFDVSQLARGKQVLRGDSTLSWMARGIEFGFVPVLLACCAAIACRSRTWLILGGIVFLGMALLITRMGQRGAAVMAGMSILLVFHFLWRRIPLVMVLGLLLAVVVGVNMLGEYRTKGRADTEFSEGISSPITTVAAHEQERQRLNVLGVIMYTFPEHRDYLMGESYYALVAVFVPRWLWPEKSQHFLWRDTMIIYNLTGLPAPTPFNGVLYANFSWLGVVLGMGIFGAFHRALNAYRERAPQDPGTVLIYVALLGTVNPTLLGLSQVFQLAVPIVLLVYSVSRRALRAPRGPLGLPAAAGPAFVLEENSASR
jgi:oligosaccharide repeat unit polymerase